MTFLKNGDMFGKCNVWEKAFVGEGQVLRSGLFFENNASVDTHKNKINHIKLYL